MRVPPLNPSEVNMDQFDAQPAMQILSLYSGLGGMDMGFANAGFDIATAVDSDPAVMHVYTDNSEARSITADVTSYPNYFFSGTRYDGVISSPPVKIRRSAIDTAALLLHIKAIADIVVATRPKFYLIELPSYLAVDNNRLDCGRVLRQLDRTGYATSWAVRDAQFHGCAQERVCCHPRAVSLSFGSEHTRCIERNRP